MGPGAEQGALGCKSEYRRGQPGLCAEQGIPRGLGLGLNAIVVDDREPALNDEFAFYVDQSLER